MVEHSCDEYAGKIMA